MTGSPFAAGADYTAGLAVHPSGRFLYAINTESISAFSIDGSTGALHTLAGSPFGFVEFNIMGGRIAIDPSGSFLYVTTQNGNRVFAFAIDPGTGQLQELASIPMTQNAQGGLRTEAIDAAGKYLYVADPGNSYIAAYSVEPGNGALAAVPGGPFPTPSGPTSIAADPTGGYVYVTSTGSDRLYTFAIDASSGALTSVPAASIPAGVAWPRGITTDARGRFLFVVTSQPGSLPNYLVAYAIDPASGALTGLPGTPLPPIGHWRAGGDRGARTERKVHLRGIRLGTLSVSSVDSVTGAVSGGSATASDLALASYTSSIVFLQ